MCGTIRIVTVLYSHIVVRLSRYIVVSLVPEFYWNLVLYELRFSRISMCLCTLFYLFIFFSSFFSFFFLFFNPINVFTSILIFFLEFLHVLYTFNASLFLSIISLCSLIPVRGFINFFFLF